MVTDALLGVALALLTALPLAWKWELGVRRAAIAVIVVGVACSLLVAAARSALADLLPPFLIVYGLSLAILSAFLAYRFYRDPERVGPDRDDVIVSPADGLVIYVRKSAGGRVPVSAKHGREYTLEELTKTPLVAQEALIVGIALSFLDVHVNRAPVAGSVVLQGHHKGVFRSLKHPESLLENERATTIIERGGNQLAVVLIASRLVRRIISYVRQGDAVACGQRIGAIRFGSQVDLVLPVDWGATLCIEPGQRVIAGQSVIAVLPGDAAADPVAPAAAAGGIAERPPGR